MCRGSWPALPLSRKKTPGRPRLRSIPLKPLLQLDLPPQFTNALPLGAKPGQFAIYQPESDCSAPASEQMTLRPQRAKAKNTKIALCGDALRGRWWPILTVSLHAFAHFVCGSTWT
jgi:hypothetical protein